MIEKYIAHACGGINGLTYSNSREALELAYKNGHRFIEFDTNKTSDGKYVLMHDWQETRVKLFGKTGQLTYKEFKDDSMLSGYHQMDLSEILEWFVEHPDTYIVSDTKEIDPIEFLEYVITNYPELKDRVIMQIYHFSEYQEIYNLGIKNIIFGTYRIDSSDQEIIDFLAGHPCYAVSMVIAKAEKGFALKVKKALNLATMVFPVNSEIDEDKYKNLGIDFFFTDYLTP